MDGEKILEIIIEAKDKATETLEKVEGKLKTHNETWEKFSRTMKIAGGIITGASVAVGGALLSTMEAYKEQIQVQERLRNTFSHMPQLMHENVREFEELAKALRKKTAVDDEAIKSAMALLGTFPVTGDEIKKLIPLVIDYSQKFGVDLNSAALQVGKAMMGQIAALQRNGVTIDENLYKTDKFAAVQKALQLQVGGYAETLANTGVMAMEKFNIALEDMRKTVGKVVTEAVGPIIDRITDWIEKIQELHPGLVETIARIALVGSAIGLVVGPMLLIIGFLPQIAAGLSLLISPVSLVVAAVAMLAVAFSTNFLHIRDIVTQIVGSISEQFQYFSAIVQDAVRIFVDVFKGNFTDLNNILIGYAENTDATTNNVIQTIAKMAIFIKEIVDDIVTWFREHWTQIKAIVEGVFNAIKLLYNLILKPALTLIIQEFGVVINWVMQNWPLIKQTIETVMHAIFAVIEPTLTMISNFWQAHGGTIITVVKNAWDIIKTTVDTVIHVVLDIIKAVMQIITGDWRGTWNTINDIVRTIFGGVTHIIRDILNSVWSIFADVARTAYNWGRNLIQNVIDGIEAMIGRVAQAASNVAKTVARFLGFHSPAEEGPGKDADKWMPNLINMMSEGLQRNIPKLQATLNTALNVPLTIPQSVTPPVNTSTGITGGITVIIELDSRTIAQKTVEHMPRLLRLKGVTI